MNYSLFIGVTAIAITILWLAKRALVGPLAKVPGPTVACWTRYVLTYHILNGNRMQYIEELHAKYGPIVRVSPLEIAINDPEGVRTIQKVSGGFDKGPWYANTGPGLLGMRDRGQHSRRRRLLAHPLSNSSLVSFEPLVQNKINLAIEGIGLESTQRGSADVYKWFCLLATDIIGDLTFGSSFRMLERGEKDEYVLDLQAILQDIHTRAELSPFINILFYLPLPAVKGIQMRLARIIEYGRQSMNRLRTAIETNTLKTPIFFSKIMDTKDTENSLTDQEMQEEAAEFMITGTDTTSNTLTYMTWAVLKHPRVKMRLENEVADLPNDYTDADAAKLAYLDCVIKESLRLYGTASGSHERSIPRGGWEVGGYYLPDYCVVSTAAYSLHRRADIFKDPLQFRPERWLDATQEMHNCFIPFGAGPRICIGIHLAYMELRLTATAFFRSFRGGTVALATTEESMHMENFTLIAPKAQKCLVQVHGTEKNVSQ